MEERLLRVLVVDDYKDAADSLCVLVKMWRHEARVAYDGAAAFELAASFQPDVLLLDIAMPTLDGFNLAQKLRRQTVLKDAALIAITGYADRTHRLLWEKAFDHYLVKPVQPSIVEHLLLLEQRRRANLVLAVPQPVTPR